MAERSAKLAGSRRRRSVGLVFAVLSALVAVQVSGASPAAALSPPVVTLHPQPAIGTGSFTMSSAATGDPAPSVRWEISHDGGTTWSTLSGATSGSITVRPPSSPPIHHYRAVWTNVQGSVASDVAVARLADPPVITQQPQSGTWTAGQTMTFTAAATGEGPVTVQWRRLRNGTWSNIPGATSPTLEVTAMPGEQSASFYAVFSVLGSGRGTSVANATIVTPLTITTHPSSRSANEGAPVTIGATAFGTDVPSVQWEVSSDGGSTWGPAAGSDSGSVTGERRDARLAFPMTVLQDGWKYRARFSSSSGEAVSNVATLTLTHLPVITEPPPPSLVVLPGEPASLSVGYTSGSPVTIQWLKAGSTHPQAAYAVIPGATGATYTISSSATTDLDRARYRVRITGSGGSVLSGATEVSVPHAPAITLQPANDADVVGGTVSVMVRATGGPRPTPTWEVSVDGTSWSSVSDQPDLFEGLALTEPGTDPPYTSRLQYRVSEADPTVRHFRVKLTNASGEVTSNVATVTALRRPTITVQPQDQLALPGEVVEFSVVSVGATSIQWRRGSQVIPGATSPTLTVAAGSATHDTSYSAVLTNAEGATTTTEAWLTVVGSAPRIYGSPVDSLSDSVLIPTYGTICYIGICPAGRDAVFTASAGPSATDVHWETSTDGGASWSIVPGTDPLLGRSSTYWIPFTSGEDHLRQVRAVFSNEWGSTPTDAATMRVRFAPQVVQHPSSSSVSAGGTATFTASFRGLPEPTIQWQVAAPGTIDWVDIDGATGPTLSLTDVDPAESGNRYRATASNPLSFGTPTPTDGAATLTVRPAAVAPTAATPEPLPLVAEGAPVRFEFSATGSPAPAVVFQVSNDGFETVMEVPDATVVVEGDTTTVIVDIEAPLMANGWQTRAVFTNAAGTVTSDPLTLRVGRAPVAEVVAPLVSVPEGTPVRLEFSATGSPAPGVVFQVSNDGFETVMEVPDATVVVEGDTTTVIVDIEAPLMANGWQARAVFTNELGTVITEPLTLLVHAP